MKVSAENDELYFQMNVLKSEVLYSFVKKLTERYFCIVNESVKMFIIVTTYWLFFVFFFLNNF